MQEDIIVKLLNETDFHIDSQGRIILDNPELLHEINGASGMFGLSTSNGACINASCH